MSSFGEMFGKLLHATGQSRASKTVEMYGWLILAEGILIFLFPEHVALLLRFGPLDHDGLMFFRLAGLLVAGIGMLYFVSGRMNAEGFVFATLLDSAARATDHGCPLVFRKITRLPRAALRGARAGQFFVDTVDVACGAPKNALT